MSTSKYSQCHRSRGEQLLNLRESPLQTHGRGGKSAETPNVGGVEHRDSGFAARTQAAPEQRSGSL